jgi:membrane-bound serine protease (ClpP class)
MNHLVLIILLTAAGLALVAGEFLIPTLGLMALLATASLVAAVYFTYLLSLSAAIALSAAIVLATPFYLYLLAKVLPNTPLGRRLTLSPPTMPAGTGTPEIEIQTGLVGQHATAESDLRPSGAIRVAGRRLIATAESGYITRGAKVEIIKAVGANVVVREAPPEQPKQ